MSFRGTIKTYKAPGVFLVFIHNGINMRVRKVVDSELYFTLLKQTKAVALTSVFCNELIIKL